MPNIHMVLLCYSGPMLRNGTVPTSAYSTSSKITYLYLKNCSGDAVMLLDLKMSTLTQAVMWRDVSWEYLGAVHQLINSGSHQLENHLLIDIGYYHLTDSIPSVIELEGNVWLQSVNSGVTWNMHSMNKFFHGKTKRNILLFCTAMPLGIEI